jgi:hypothetical protein
MTMKQPRVITTPSPPRENPWSTGDGDKFLPAGPPTRRVDIPHGPDFPAPKSVPINPAGPGQED